jgi:hypothetical protein
LRTATEFSAVIGTARGDVKGEFCAG